MTRTKRQLETELETALARLELMSKEAVMMREIVSVNKCLETARQLLAEKGDKASAEILADFISRVWWIDLQPSDLITQPYCPEARPRQ